MPPVSFNEIPSNTRVPFFHVEFDGSRAQQVPSAQPYKILAIGQKLGGGSQAVNTPVRITSTEGAASAFGNGSMLFQMAGALFANNRATEAWFVAVADPAGGEATGTLTFTGTATAAGTISLYIGGHRVQAAVASGDTAAAVATAVAAAITADASLPMSASSSLAVVTLTAKHVGLVGNATDVRIGYYVEEVLPTGVGVTIVQPNGGSGAPDLSALTAALGDEHFNIWINPFTDAASLAALDTELSSRWGPQRQIEGLAIAAHPGSHSSVGTFGDAMNSKFHCVMGNYGSPTQPLEWAAAVAGAAALAGQIDPARPFQRLSLKGVMAPLAKDRFTHTERDLLLFDGIATFTVDAGGNVSIERLITTYKKNAAGADDTAYLDANTMLTIALLRYEFRTYFLVKYPRHKLADDGTQFGDGQKVLTPKTAKAECFALFRSWESRGLVEGFDQFANDIVVERDPQDPNRLNFLLPPNLVNQFRIGAAQISFLL